MKGIYLFLILSSKIVESCENICEVCSLNSILFVKNKCTGFINSTFQPESLSCEFCIDSSTSTKKPCTSSSSDLISCKSSEICGESFYDSAQGKFLLKSPPSSTLCKWTIDLRLTKKTTQTIETRFFSGEIGTLAIFSYLLKNENHSKDLISRIVLFNNLTSSRKTFKLEDSNYLVLLYSTMNYNLNYSNLEILWNDDSSQGMTLSSILTIVALCVSFLFCLSCTFLLLKRLYKSHKQQRFQIESSLTARVHSRNYQAVQETSVISEQDIQRMFPRTHFHEELLEVGEKTCCICFEEMKSTSLVRKLPCKHLFHAKCIEDWFVGRVTRPKCPLCKFSPFEEEDFPNIQEVNRDSRDASLIGLN